MGMFRKIKGNTRKLRAFSYSKYTGKIVRDFRERQAGAGVEDRQDDWQKELEEYRRRHQQVESEPNKS
ncbi:MAG: hypothetical protein Q8Q22_02015 [bacterium]|nr:hypothetical protein [bacterium]